MPNGQVRSPTGSALQYALEGAVYRRFPSAKERAHLEEPHSEILPSQREPRPGQPCANLQLRLPTKSVAEEQQKNHGPPFTERAKRAGLRKHLNSLAHHRHRSLSPPLSPRSSSSSSSLPFHREWYLKSPTAERNSRELQNKRRDSGGGSGDCSKSVESPPGGSYRIPWIGSWRPCSSDALSRRGLPSEKLSVSPPAKISNAFGRSRAKTSRGRYIPSYTATKYVRCSSRTMGNPLEGI